MSTNRKPRPKKAAETVLTVPARTGYQLTFPGVPKIWFSPDRAADAMMTLDAMVRNFRAAYGRCPRGAALTFNQGYEEPVAMPMPEAEAA